MIFKVSNDKFSVDLEVDNLKDMIAIIEKAKSFLDTPINLHANNEIHQEEEPIERTGERLPNNEPLHSRFTCPGCRQGVILNLHHDEIGEEQIVYDKITNELFLIDEKEMLKIDSNLLLELEEQEFTSAVKRIATIANEVSDKKIIKFKDGDKLIKFTAKCPLCSHLDSLVNFFKEYDAMDYQVCSICSQELEHTVNENKEFFIVCTNCKDSKEDINV